MELFSRADFRALVGRPPDLGVSIFMPTERGGQSQQNAIRFKNLLRQAEERIAADKLLRPPAIRELLRAADELIDEVPFWQRQHAGLAVFIAAGFFRTWRVPIAFDELAVVDRGFHVKPMLQLLSGDGRFYVLGLDLKQVRLFESTRYHISEVPLGDTPTRLEDAVGYTLEGPQAQWHTGVSAPSRGERSGAIFHGSGGGEEDVKADVRKFFAAVDHGVNALLHDKEAPLVLAAVEYLLPIYRQVSAYPHLADGEVRHHPTELKPDELRERAWAIVEPRFAAEQRGAEERYRALAGTGRTSADPAEVVPASHDGRVEALFVASGVQRWGRYDVEGRAVELHEAPGLARCDLLDLAAVQTVLHGGRVYVVPADQMPGPQPLAALLRY